jgi:enoyl-[acyl-carrier protein] reductase/trans-2-enoyl-CoA reductase (NAD+)
MKPETQEEVFALWPQVNTENIESLSDIEGYRHEFRRLFGFELEGVDYSADVDPDVKIPSI